MPAGFSGSPSGMKGSLKEQGGVGFFLFFIGGFLCVVFNEDVAVICSSVSRGM